MIAAPTRLEELVRFGGGLDHLAECPHSRLGAVDHCDWCRWAALTPELAQLVVVEADARTLLGAQVVDTIAGVVAAARLFELFDDAAIERIAVPSARELAARVRRETAEKLTLLERRVREVTAAGGPIDRRCCITGGTIAAAAMQMSGPRGAASELVTMLPDGARTALDELSRQMSGEVQVASLLPVVDHLHWRGMPELISQPEWSRRPAPSIGGDLRRLQLEASGPAPGSLEALVVESVIERCTERLLELGDELAAVAEPVRCARPSSHRRFDGRLRATVWRVLRIDWHLTFIDSGLARCWGPTHDVPAGAHDCEPELAGNERRVAEVPRLVALAVRALGDRGYGSALYSELPTMEAG